MKLLELEYIKIRKFKLFLKNQKSSKILDMFLCLKKLSNYFGHDSKYSRNANKMTLILYKDLIDFVLL